MADDCMLEVDTQGCAMCTRANIFLQSRVSCLMQSDLYKEEGG